MLKPLVKPPRLIYMIGVCCLQMSERKLHIWVAFTHYLNIRLLTTCKWSPLVGNSTDSDWHPVLEDRLSSFNYKVWMWSDGIVDTKASLWLYHHYDVLRFPVLTDHSFAPETILYLYLWDMGCFCKLLVFSLL